MGCSTENEFIEQEHFQQSNVRKISFQEFSTNKIALKSLQTIEEKVGLDSSARIVHNNTNNFYINIDEIVIAEEDGRKFFTFSNFKGFLERLDRELGFVRKHFRSI